MEGFCDATQEGDTAIMDVDADGRINVLNGSGTVLSGTVLPDTPAGIA